MQCGGSVMLKQGEQMELACTQRCTSIILPSAAQSATATQEICGVCQHGQMRKVAFRWLPFPFLRDSSPAHWIVAAEREPNAIRFSPHAFVCVTAKWMTCMICQHVDLQPFLQARTLGPISKLAIASSAN